MNILFYMIPAALALAGIALGAFVWALRSGQFEDPAGSAARAIQEHERPAPGKMRHTDRLT
ncbi:MAG TPA: cbb3-type cytochrome oxidase assembly protein CcoS [Hyphomonadaceae bacterium]|jgi:cbb3-type cytochrome oxidase maturation protein